MDMQVNSAELANAANDLRKDVSDMQTVLDESTSVINKYAKFLDNTAAAYESADKKIEERANELLNEGYNA